MSKPKLYTVVTLTQVSALNPKQAARQILASYLDRQELVIEEVEYSQVKKFLLLGYPASTKLVNGKAPKKKYPR